MRKLLIFSIAFLLLNHVANASFVPALASESDGKSVKTISLSEFEARTGKKLNWMERMQFKHAQKMLAKGKAPAFWDAEELTEGFQVWPFLGSFFTLGILYLVMLFTAKDSNALRWARWGAFAIWIVYLASMIYLLTQEGYY
jgi:hypothetical protein